MSKKEIGKLIKEQFLCRIAFTGERFPHIVPLQYVFLIDALYFHFAEYGTKMK
jgi:nitroimidazol reductase NimA-like FMN-containing flavoprotein (pyridoxamine 5'-phosphate oxidase superfamily)